MTAAELFTIVKNGNSPCPSTGGGEINYGASFDESWQSKDITDLH